MAGVYERLTSGKKDAAVAQGGGVSFVPEDKGVYAKIARENQGVHSRITQEKPSDPIHDQWKLEQQMRAEMERVRQERLQQQKEAAVKAGAPAMAMQPVVTAAQVAVEQARKNQGAAQERAAKSMWKGAQRDIHAAISAGNLGALEGLAKRSAEKREVLDAVREGRTEAANRQAAPERYDNAVTLKGTALQESYNAEAMAKGAKAAGNPLVDFEGYVEDRRKATGQSPAAMFGVARGADGKGARAAEFLSTLSGKEREYIDYLYGTYDRQKAAQLLQAYLTNRANEQTALQPQAVDAAQQAENAVQQAEEKTMGRNAGKVPVYIQSHLQDAQRGAAINNNAGGVVAGMLSKPAYAVETVAQSVRNLAKGTDLTAPLYSEAALGVADSKAAEKRFLDNFENKKLQWVAGVGLSIANSAANRLLGPLGKFMMGLQAMGGDAYDLAQEGEDATTILMHSALVGIAEGVAESISWGRLDEILNGMTPKTFRGLLKTVSAQMGTEFGEEAVTEGVNILTDWATRGENSTIAEVAAQAKEDGREHPGWYTAGVMAGQIALAGLAGAFSGGIMGGSALALNAMRNQIGGNAAKANGQAVGLAQKAENAAGNDTARVKPEGPQGDAEPRAEETPKIAKSIWAEAAPTVVEKEEDAAKMNAFIPGSAVVRGEENGKRTADTENADEKSREREKRELVAKFAEDKSLSAEEKVKRIDFYLNMDRLSHKVNMDAILDSGNIDPTMSEEEYRRLEAKDRIEILEELGRFNEYRNAGGSVEEYIKNGTQEDDTKVVEAAKPVVETQQSVGGNTQSVVADSSGVAENVQGVAKNTQNAAEKKPPVNWRARNIDAEEDLEAAQPLINEQGLQVEPKAIDATDASVKDGVPQPMENVDTQKAQTGQNSVVEETSRPENKRSAESRAQDAARELRTGSAGKEKILQTIQQMDAETMTPEMRRVVAQNVAKELVENTPNVSKSLWQSTKALREYLHKTKMHIDAETTNAIKKMGLSVTKFNDRYGTRLTTKNEPGMRSLDGSLAKLARVSNGFISADADSAFEELVHTLDAMEKWKVGELDAQGMEKAIDGAAEVLLKYAEETMEPDELEALDKKDGKKPEIQSSTSQVKPQGTGWEKFEDNRIAQEMHQKPEGAVANMGDAERVRHAEEEIRKAKNLLEGLKDPTRRGEIKIAEAVAEGSMTLRQVPEDFQRERVALMAEQMRLIKEWEKTGLKGQKTDIAVQQYRDSNEILDQSDDELFTGEGDQKARLVSTGALMRRTPMRALVKVFGDTTAANMAIDALVRPTLANESAKIQAINRIFDRVRKLNVNKYESTMVQLVGEGLVPAWDAAKTNPLWHNGQQMVENLPLYARANPEIKELAAHLDRIDAKKVTKAVKELREMYNDYFSLVNEFRLAHGMPEIGHIKNYFPHFEGNMDGDLMNQALKAFGIEQMSNLPTGIAGLSANFKPKSRFVANFLRRRGPKTTYDAMAGFQMYTNAVMDMLYHTDDIMRLRYMESAVRERAKMQGEEGKRVSLSERLLEKAQDAKEREVMEQRLDSITENAELEKEYGGFVVWLREYANALAGKGSQFDRGVEGYGSRNLQNVLNKTMSRYSTALVVGNIKSALANVSVVPKTMAIMATEGKLLDPEKYASKALVAMASGQMRDVWHKSEFLSGKEGIDPLVKKGKDVYAEKAQIVFDVIERFMSRFVFATKYQQKMDEMAGLKITPEERENAAVQAANDFAAQIMSRRDKAGATLYSRSRSPIMKMLNMYQNEIWNSFYQNIDDIPNALKAVEKRHGKERARKAFANVATHYVVHSAVLDGVCEAVLGFSIVPNPLEYLVELLLEFIDPDDEEDDEKSNMEAIVAVAADIAGHLPSVSAAMALAGYDSGRVPLPNVVDIGDDIAGIKKATTWQGKTAAVIDVLAGIGQFTGFPTAGQLAKTAKGVLSITEGGVRSRSTGQLQTVYKGGDGERLRAVFFGPSGTKGMQQYYESGYKAELTKKQTEAYDAKVKAGVPKDEALEYAKDIMPTLTSSQLEAYDAAIGAGIYKDTALSYVKWSKGVTAKKDVPNSKRIQYLQQANEFESLTGEQRAILYQGALPSDQAKEFEEMTQKVDRLGVDVDTWMEFLERYYQIRGSGKKQRVRELMEDLELPQTTAQILGDIIGYDIR